MRGFCSQEWEYTLFKKGHCSGGCAHACLHASSTHSHILTCIQHTFTHTYMHPAHIHTYLHAFSTHSHILTCIQYMYCTLVSGRNSYNRVWSRWMVKTTDSCVWIRIETRKQVEERENFIYVFFFLNFFFKKKFYKNNQVKQFVSRMDTRVWI